MNTIKLSLVFLFCTLFTPVISQVRVGGGVSVDVNINLPIPDVVVIGRKPAPPVVVTQPREQRPVIHTCDHHCNHNEAYGYGEIQNQNGPYGRQIYQVLNAQLQPLGNGQEKVMYRLDSGDVLELVIVTANHNDYNYHSYSNCDCHQNNRITDVLLNGQQIALRDGSLSLQPRGANQFHSVINLHSFEEGDFNGTVNF